MFVWSVTSGVAVNRVATVRNYQADTLRGLTEGRFMTGIKVTPEQLQVLSGNVARGSSDIDGTLAALRGQLAPLLGGDWAGQASGQFSALWEQWQQSAKGLNEALAGISRLLGQAGQSYAEAEQQIAASFR
jgi:WXG100 family type VII secretion target